VKKLFYVLIAAMATSLLGGCLDTGSSAPPPPWLTSTAGDGRVVLNWTATPGVDYWVFAATDPALTAFNWTGLANAQAVVASPVPSYICGLIDGMTYYFATNGRINGGPGGPSSPTISLMPHNASANWQLNGTTLSSDIYGLGYTGLTTCANNAALSATGTFAAVGAGGAIFTSPDAISWTAQSSPIATNLNAVAGYAVNQNNATTPGLRWVAVGNGGKAVYSTDGINWTAATATTTTQNLRSIIQVSGSFYAVGDAGTIVSSSDGNSWSTPQTITPTVTYSLNGIAHAGYWVAVGNNGAIVTNGGSWVSLPNSVPTSYPQPLSTSPTTQNLRQVAAIATVYGSIYVAVGDNGTIVTSDSYNHNGRWTLVGSPDDTPGNTVPLDITTGLAPNFVGVTVEPRGVETTTAYTTAPQIDPWLGFISAAQFVAIDNDGNTYTSINGHDWTASVSTGITACTTGTSCMNPLISSGFGYVAVGDNGKTAYAF